MDKRWKNLGIIIVVIIIIFVLVNLFLLPKEEEVKFSELDFDEFDSEFLVLYNLFELSDLNISLFRQNDLTSFESDKVELVYSKEQLLEFKDNLVELKLRVREKFGDKDYTQFNSLVDIYVSEINLNIKLNEFSEKFNSVMSSGTARLYSEDESEYCSFVGENYPDLTFDFEEIDNDLVELVSLNHNYYLEYDILVIDYDFEFFWDNLNYAWDSIYSDVIYCDERGLIE